MTAAYRKMKDDIGRPVDGYILLTSDMETRSSRMRRLAMAYKERTDRERRANPERLSNYEQMRRRDRKCTFVCLAVVFGTLSLIILADILL